MILVDVAGAAPMPWKNGGGVTRELLKLPADAGADDWTLRISVADIDADGPFSPFPGIARWFAVLSGAGVRLRWPARALHLHAGEAPLHFDGGDAPDCTLFDGPTRDLNVMARSSKAGALVEVASWDDRERWASSVHAMGFFALQPLRLLGPQDAPVNMPALSLCWHEPTFGPPRPWGILPARDNGDGQEHTAGLPGYWISLQAAQRPRR